MTTIDDAAVREHRSAFRGALLRPGEEGYDEARHVWNGDVDRRPGLIARCAGADDVAAAVRFARAHDLPSRYVAVVIRSPGCRSVTTG